MNMYGDKSGWDRLFASLVYLLPFFDGIGFGGFLFQQFHLESIFGLLLGIYMTLPLQPYTGLIVFFVLLFAVVRNERVSHFIRYNTMQAILVDLVLLLFGLLLDVAKITMQGGLLVETLYNTVFLGLLAVVGYSVFQSVMGRYAEIPVISDAVNMQVRN